MARQVRQFRPQPLPAAPPEPPRKLIAFDKFERMNTKVARQNLAENEAAWIENLQWIAANDLQAVPGPGQLHGTITGKTVTRQFPAYIGGNDYIIFFATDGSCTALNHNTNAQTTVAAAGTFSNTPDVTDFASQRILIMDPTGGYATWDGTLFVKGGGLSPNIHVTAGGSLYATAPTVEFAGGNGHGATATATVLPIVVASVTVTNGGSGYTVPPTVNFAGGGGGSGAAATAVLSNDGSVISIFVTNGGSGYTSVPTINFTGGGGGINAAATAVLGGGAVLAVTLTNPGTGYLPNDTVTVKFTGGGGTGATATVVVWPQVKGITLDVFAGRVWWASADANGQYRILNFTGTAGYDDINTANAAGSTVVSDIDLVHNINAIRNRNNYLYIFGDESIRQIGSITVASSITQFTPLTLSSDIGTTFLMSIMSYNRVLLFANKQGVYGVFGASVQKISDDLDGIFQLTDFTQELSAALNDINNIHCYLLLLRYLDPARGARSIIAIFQHNKWFVASQGDNIKSIVPLASNQTNQWETMVSSGADIQHTFENNALPVSVLLKTSLTAHGNIIRAKKAVKAGVAVTSGTAQNFSMNVVTENGTNPYPLSAAAPIVWLNNSGGAVSWLNNSAQTVTFLAGGYRFPYASVDGYGKVLGMDVSGTVLNFSINAAAIEYVEADDWGLLP